MTGNEGKSADRIQALLDDRLKVMQWLDKLNAAPDDIPADVRSRVRADYQTRLDGVANELQTYTSELQSNLLKQQHGRDALSEKEKAADARLAEAKLRHAVGEFGEDQWTKLNGEISTELATVRGQISHADGEIRRLEEVLDLIKQKPPSTQIRQALPMVEPPPPAPAPSPPPPPAAPQVKVSTGQSNDLAFINPANAPIKPRQSLGVTHGPPPPESPVPEPAVPAPAAPGQPPTEAGGPKKTLKCGECGVMNFPTEWYCERCGAELAAL